MNTKKISSVNTSIQEDGSISLILITKGESNSAPVNITSLEFEKIKHSEKLIKLRVIRGLTVKNHNETMLNEEIALKLESGFNNCVIEAKTSGYICWDENDTSEREPRHSVIAGDRFTCWNFKKIKTGGYTHSYGNMGPDATKITTDVELELVYVSEDWDEISHFSLNNENSPNIT